MLEVDKCRPTTAQGKDRLRRASLQLLQGARSRDIEKRAKMPAAMDPRGFMRCVTDRALRRDYEERNLMAGSCPTA